jgi:RNA polymerase sigma-70 factor (ECF subfamily)
MRDSPDTRPSLLIRLRDPKDERAWGEFVDIYNPLIHRLAKQAGLQGADADDLAQEVFRAVRLGRAARPVRRAEPPAHRRPRCPWIRQRERPGQP